MIGMTGSVERHDSRINDIIPSDAKIEVLSKGYAWSEGPVWVDEINGLLFSDIPNNQINLWTAQNGTVPYLNPSGYTGTIKRGGEIGSNGLILDNDKRLILCQHGDRRMARMDAPLSDPSPNFISLASHFESKRFNSPNDCVCHSNGDIFFTDPAYGLEHQMDDPAKELDFQGVYKVTNEGEVSCLCKTMSRPNGLAFNKDESILYVGNSDPNMAIWNKFDLNTDGTLSNERIFFDSTSLLNTHKGLPDGLKINDNGIMFMTGPGGVLVMDQQANLLGLINTGELVANVNFGGTNRKWLFMTADSYLMRIALC